MKLSDIELKELSQLVYLDIPKELHLDFINNKKLNFGEFINYYKTYPEQYEGQYNEREKIYYKSLLDKYSDPKYENVT
ncbi:MAG: hypothetical protein ACRDDY_16090, partial [Clostridium sp.]|uniref:hypothetical protein n=1 Tax=Clostridium sp. TaxID=1506 RepID=UPI003EE4C8D4